jgi:tetratricopeptide (TPR) repeat protein
MMHRKTSVTILLSAAVLVACSNIQAKAKSSVRIYEESLTIPTYEIGKPDPNPRFYAGRAYQGAQGRAYPYPMMDRLTTNRKDKDYNAVYLENDYIKICILPELGGRVFSALDKTNDHDFLYRQHVIKPGLVGMLGAWLSGGIEWNYPHHHRATVFMPIEHVLEKNPDGSKTLWLGEIEIRHRTKMLIGITMFPGKSYFEAVIKPFNRSPLVHSFLYWANVSVYANENYQVIFPPSTEYAVYHGKNQFASWPIAREMYRGVDYTDSVDISWWKNHPSPMSFFAWNYEDDFLAGYDHGKKAGTAYVANHHIAPGKKFWEWGPSSRGQIWDKILTDTDGPYLELMVGAYSDNQPDYSWLQPYEAKVIRQYWYPIRQIGGVKNATLEAAVNLQVTGDTAEIGFNATSHYRNARVLLKAGQKTIFEIRTDIAPDKPFVKRIVLPSGVKEGDLRISLLSYSDKELVAYQPVKKKGTPMPDEVKPPPPPEDIKTVEELYLTGLRLEQFYNPAFQPYPYYEEALKRDPGNYRVNVALGISHLKAGRFEEAKKRLRIAIKRVTKDYTSPRDGEAYYYLGLVLKLEGNYDAAYDSLYKATWSSAFHTAAYYNLAEIDCMRGEFSTALKHLDRSIATNSCNTKALNLKATVLRRKGKLGQAAKAASRVLETDPLNFWAEYELYLVKSRKGLKKEATKALASLKKKRGDKVYPWYEAQPYLEIAVDYGNCGLWDEAIGVLSLLTDGKANAYPLLYYYVGYFYEQKGDAGMASKYYGLASQMPPDYCFPFRLESISMLRAAQKRNPQDARAFYYLGNLLYNDQKENAMREWEKSRSLDSSLATVHRNLALAYFEVDQNVEKAIVSMERAVACDNKKPRLFYELDVLYQAGGADPQERLALLEENHETIVSHNDALAREVLLLTQLAYYDKAIQIMKTHHFRRWEGLGNIHTSYVDAHLLRGQGRVKAERYEEALEDFGEALNYPDNLEVARSHHGGRDCQTYYFMAAAYEASGNDGKAKELYEKSAAAKQRDGWTELRYYKGMAFKKLGQKKNANENFVGLIDFAKEQFKTTGKLEFFAKFGTRLSENERMANLHYLTGLGYLGKGKSRKARAEFEKALKLNVNHLWARKVIEY